MIYLDYQATSPLAPEAFAAMRPWLEQQHANPHSAHAPGRAAKAAVEAARDEIAKLLPAGGRVVFTSGATEALNWAIKGVDGAMLTFATEHAAVLESAQARELPAVVLPVSEASGLIDIELAQQMITPGVRLVAAMLVNNEIGVIQPVERLAEVSHEAGALFLCDAVQGFGRMPIPDTCDLIALSAHKIYGPKGIGALWIRDGIELGPLLHGGFQEVGGRSGTLSPALCAGFGTAARLARERLDADHFHVARLSELALQRLGDDWQLNGDAERRYRGNLNVRQAGLDVARLMSDLRDIAFSAGSACASGSGRPSHVLRAIGLTETQARSSIRLGFGRYTTEEDLLTAVDRIGAAARAQKATI